MIDDYLDDADELDADVYSKEFKLPKEIMEHNFMVVHKRDWKSYLNSIEWDTWCKHDTDEERLVKQEAILKRKTKIRQAICTEYLNQ